MKGSNDILEPTAPKGNIVDHILYSIFEYNTMTKRDSLRATISQYPPELLALLGSVTITDKEGLELMRHMSTNNT